MKKTKRMSEERNWVVLFNFSHYSLFIHYSLFTIHYFKGKFEISVGTSGHMNKVLVPLSQNATRLKNKVSSILRLFQICVSALFSRFQKLFSFLTETSGSRIFCQKSSWTNLKTIVIQTFSSHFEKHLDPVLTWFLQSLWTKQKTWEYSEAIVNYPHIIYIETRTIQKDM